MSKKGRGVPLSFRKNFFQNRGKNGLELEKNKIQNLLPIPTNVTLW
jgi:hypothetical protein